MLSDRDIETVRERVQEQLRLSRWIMEHCAHLRVELARQAADLAALAVELRVPPASRITSRDR